MRNMRRIQIEGLIEKQKSLINPKNSRRRNVRAYGIWAGFLNGLKINDAITHEEYKILFEKLKDFKNSNSKDIFLNTKNCEESDEQELWSGFFDGLRITKVLSKKEKKR